MPASKNTKDSSQQQQFSLSLRSALNDAYAAVEGFKVAQTFQAITFEDLCQQQIDLLSGPGTPTRPNEIADIQNIVSNLTQAALQLADLPDSAFQSPDPSSDVNPPA